jgi:hypothetical protein
MRLPAARSLTFSKMVVLLALAESREDSKAKQPLKLTGPRSWFCEPNVLAGDPGSLAERLAARLLLARYEARWECL